VPRPNARGKVALFIIAAIIFLVVGFVCGQLVKALTTLPGDKDDPVVTQSYVETQIGERLATLTTRLDEVEAELAALKGSGTTTPNGTGTTTPSGNGNTGTQNSGTGTSTSSQTVRITGNSVNFRSGPGTNYDSLGSLSKGDTATYLSTEGNWYKIRRGNTTGYVSSDYATLQ